MYGYIRRAQCPIRVRGTMCLNRYAYNDLTFQYDGHMFAHASTPKLNVGMSYAIWLIKHPEQGKWEEDEMTIPSVPSLITWTI